MMQRPPVIEDEYFLLQEAGKLRHAAAAREEKIHAAEKEARKKLHWMKCPKDGSDLVEIRLFGVTIDKCFTCEGIFLGAGGLEQVVKNETYFLNRLHRAFGYNG